MSQRIHHIERWVAPRFPAYDESIQRCNYVLNMSFTTFDEIDIDSRSTYTTSFIVKLSTSSNTTFHGVNTSRKDERLPTKDDYYQKDGRFLLREYGYYEESLDDIGKVTVVCADVNRLKVAYTLIKIHD